MRRIVIDILIAGLLISFVPAQLASPSVIPHQFDLIAENLGSTGFNESHTAPTSRQKYDSVLEDLPQKIQEKMQQQRLASVSIAIVDGGEIIYSRAFGYANIEKKIPAAKDTIYPIGSVTKVFTATMLMQLCEKGVLNLETPLKKYLPEYHIKSIFPGVQPTILGQLASHTSGLPQDAPINFWCNYSGFGWIVTGGKADLTWYVSKNDLLSSLDQIELEHQPGIYSHYSNLGIQLLGIALERASGQSFVDHVESQILKPLGMKNSGFMLDEEKRSLIAVGHVCSRPQSPFMATPLWEPGCAIYSGGLNATAEDMARFISLQFQTGPASKEQILSTGSLRRMRTPNSVRHPGRYTSYGIGWAVVQIEGYDAIEHNGALLGHSAHVSAIPDLGLGIVVLSNSRNVLFSPDACKDLAREIYKDLIIEMKETREEKAFDPSSLNLDQYTGKYELPGGFAEMEIIHKEGKLFMTIVQDPGFNESFVPIDRYEFSFEADPARNPALLFQTDEKGEATSVNFLSYRFKKIKNKP